MDPGSSLGNARSVSCEVKPNTYLFATACISPALHFVAPAERSEARAPIGLSAMSLQGRDAN